MILKNLKKKNPDMYLVQGMLGNFNMFHTRVFREGEIQQNKREET